MRGPFTRLPQPPRDRNGISPLELAKWFDKIWLILSGAPGIAWEIVDKSGSTLNEIVTRPHSMLQSILGWTTGADTTADKHISQATGKVWQDHVEITNANPHGTDHAMLDSIAVLDPTDSDTVKERHLSNAQAKVWQDHTADTSIHHAPAAAAADTSTTITGTAGAAYTATEQGMINALKADVIMLNTALNDLKAKLRVPGTLTP